MTWNTEEQDTQRNEVLTDFFGGHQEEELTSEWLERLREFEGLMMKYNSAIREITTKLEVLNDELSFSSRRNPIESIQARIKRPYSIARKLRRLGQPVTVESISTNLNDVAGVRVICPFLDDIYAISDMLLKQDDIQLVAKKDYIQQPKPNGYRSLHLIIEIPIFFFHRQGNDPGRDPDPHGGYEFLGQLGTPDPIQKRCGGPAGDRGNAVCLCRPDRRDRLGDDAAAGSDRRTRERAPLTNRPVAQQKDE